MEHSVTENVVPETYNLPTRAAILQKYDKTGPYSCYFDRLMIVIYYRASVPKL